MSFVNLMASDVWSEQDVINRMEAMIRSQYSSDEQSILNRKISGAMVGQYAMTADEQAEVAAYAGVCRTAQLEGRDARADMALLSQVLALEAAQVLLARPDDGTDADARAAAQTVVEQATPEALALYALRNPPETAQ